MGSAAFSSDVKGASGLAPRTSHAPPPGSFRNAGRTAVMGKSAGLPFMVDDDSSSSDDDDDDDVEEVNVDGDDGSTSFRSTFASHTTKPKSSGMDLSSVVAARDSRRNESLRRKEIQRVESEKLRRDALMRRGKEGMKGSAGGLGLGDLGAVKEEEEVDVTMEEGKDVKMEEEDKVVEDSNGREAEVITLSDSDEEGDVISVASASSGPLPVAELPNVGNIRALNDRIEPHQGSNEPKRPPNTTEEARHRHEALSQEKPNTSTIQAPESTPTENTTASASQSPRLSQNSTFSRPPSKSSALQDATERIRQERLENAKRIWQGTQARAQAEAEKARQREAAARAESVHRNSVYSGSTPAPLERPTRQVSSSVDGRAEAERHEVHEDRVEEVEQDNASPGKHEETTASRAANVETNEPETWQKFDYKPQKEGSRRESLIEPPVPNKPSIDDLAKQRKERQAALVREAEQKLAAEAAKKAESERQMAAYRNAMSSRPAVASVYGKQGSSVEARKDRVEDVRTLFESDEPKSHTVEVEQQEAPMSLNFSAGNDGPKATNVPAEPLQTKGQSANPNAVNPHRSAAQPKSLKTVAEQGGTITRAKPVKPELLQLKPLQKSHAPRIEILPEDIKLFFWRDAGNEWQDIIEDYEEATGKRKGEDALRKRYRQVKEALDGVGASRELLARVGTGDVEAKRVLDAVMPQVAVDAEKRPNVETKAGIKASGKDQLGELTLHDIQLLVSKGNGMIWSQAVREYAISTGENVSESLLRARYKLVKEAIEESEVDDSLLAQVTAGDDTAREKLNRLVHGVWPVPRIETERKVGRPSKESSHDRRLGHVSADDIRLVRWREDGMSVAEMAEALRQTTGRSMVIKTVLKRCSQARRALDAAGVYADRALLDAVENGDQEVCSRLNQLIHSTVTASHVGEILPEDVMMVQEKQRGTTYENIVSAYRRRTGRNRSFSWVYERCKSVKALLDPLDIDTRLLESVACGNQEARRRLNSLVPGERRLYASTSSTGSSKTPGERAETQFQTRSRFPESASHTQELNLGFSTSSAYSSSHGSREDQNVSTPPTSPGSFVPQPIAEEARPTTAGKQMNEAAFRYYLEEIREERLHEEDADTDSDEAEEDEFTEEDFCHFIYQVERREIGSGEEDDTIDEKDWIVYGKPLTDRLKATAIASKQALIAHDRQLNDAIYAGNNWSLNRQNLNNGILYTLDSPAGTVQVRVQEYQRSFQEEVRPSESVAWVSRTTYTVMQRQTETARSTNSVTVTEKEFDPTLDEEHDITTEKEINTVREIHKEKIVGDVVYTTPDLANDAAMCHFVAETYHPRTINLTVRDLERANLINEYREKYEGHGEEDIPLFREVVEDEHGNSLEVWVQATQLKGPRNV
ncbi:hypothetical protein KC347_g6849 [Hortaea werneckii]|nr:hypothetical protein KC347_g6849 [Hortaea werneckii]